MRDVDVIDDPTAAVAALEPIRARLLAELAQPGSASTLAARVGLPRQRVNYHLRALEAHGLVHLVREQPRRGLTERVMQASAAAYVVSPGVLGQAAADPERAADRFSASYLVALAARVVREVGDLGRRADQAGKRLATLSLDTQVRFRSPADRASFTRELADAVAGLVARYHDADAPGGRAYRVIVAAHPLPTPATQQEDA
ncbi:MAG: helix-turn-helix domain-containing protein [Chloroflexota bacterium]|nr:helix-turn-helix domain-containing protein [Chloroflexota bacterium]